MKKRTTRTRAKLKEPLNLQLDMYALAATATGLGGFASAPGAEAKIVYTPVHLVIQHNETYLVDLNHDGVVDFGIYHAFDSIANQLSARSCPGGNGAAGVDLTSSSQGFYDFALKEGVRIDQKFRHGRNNSVQDASPGFRAQTRPRPAGRGTWRTARSCQLPGLSPGDNTTQACTAVGLESNCRRRNCRISPLTWYYPSRGYSDPHPLS